MTAAAVHEETGVNLRTVTSALAVHRGLRCRITGYDRQPGFYCKAAAVWSYGGGRSASKKPPRLGATEIDRRYRGRLKTVVSSVWSLGTRIDARCLGARAS